MTQRPRHLIINIKNVNHQNNAALLGCLSRESSVILDANKGSKHNGIEKMTSFALYVSKYSLKGWGVSKVIKWKT